MALVLVLAEADPNTKERRQKGSAICARGIGGVKTIIALLAEVVAFYVRFTKTEVKASGL